MFTKQNNSNPCNNIKIFANGEEIELVSQFKYLGVWLDTHLDFMYHSEVVKGKVTLACGLISKILRRLDNRMFTVLLHAYVLSYFDETSIIWGFNDKKLRDSNYN